MDRKYSSNDEALAVAKQAVWLAWNACGGPSHYGVMRDQGPAQDIEKVWDHAYNERDYEGGHKGDGRRISCDYVMGRMMKIRFEIMGSTITHLDHNPDRAYQSWCGKYPTFAALFDAAEVALKQAA